MSETAPKKRAVIKNPVKSPVKIPKKITETYLTNSGKFYLERFPASIAQFKHVMTRKIQKSCRAHPDQELSACMIMLDAVAQKFTQAGLLNDQGYAVGLTRSLTARGWPQKRIAMKLKEKGISADEIENAFQDAEPQPDIIQAIRFIRRKKLGAYATKEIAPEKELGSLARAGFAYETASRILAMDKEEAEDLLGSL